MYGGKYDKFFNRAGAMAPGDVHSQQGAAGRIYAANRRRQKQQQKAEEQRQALAAAAANRAHQQKAEEQRRALAAAAANRTRQSAPAPGSQPTSPSPRVSCPLIKALSGKGKL